MPRILRHLTGGLIQLLGNRALRIRRTFGVANLSRRGIIHSTAGQWELEKTRPLRVLLVASSGGHLSELVRLINPANTCHEMVWVTFDGTQSQSLLAGQDVVHTGYVSPRDIKGVVAATRDIFRSFRDRSFGMRSFDVCISTGSGVALAAFIWAACHRIPRAYIESVARTADLSLTGKVVLHTRLAAVFAQSPVATRNLPKFRSVLANYEPFDRKQGAHEVRSVLVTVGTISPYRFDALVDSVLAILPRGATITWQLGVTDRTDLPGSVYDVLAEEDFLTLCRTSDVVICHAGVGTVMSLFDMGLTPVVIPRRRFRSEHVDDHQLEICGVLEDSGIGVVREVESLNLEGLRLAMDTGVRLKTAAMATDHRRSVDGSM